MQLLSVNQGEERTIFKLNLHQRNEIHRLAHQGIYSGEMIKVISNSNALFVVESKGTRLAIDAATASKILVY